MTTAQKYISQLVVCHYCNGEGKTNHGCSLIDKSFCFNCQGQGFINVQTPIRIS